jgi:nucleoside-triphosphatase THEP1
MATLLITGDRQVGKSTALARAVTTLRARGFRISGLLTERAGEHDLVVHELHTGARYPLTDPFDAGAAHSPLRHFQMNAGALARSSQALAASFPTQVFVLDEIGPLELRHGQGWVAALDLLNRADYELAAIVVRPQLLGELIERLPGCRFELIRVTLQNRDRVPQMLVRTISEACGDRV